MARRQSTDEDKSALAMATTEELADELMSRLEVLIEDKDLKPSRLLALQMAVTKVKTVGLFLRLSK